MTIIDKITKKQTPLVMIVEIVVIILILMMFSFSSCSQYKQMEQTAVENMVSEDGMGE